MGFSKKRCGCCGYKFKRGDGDICPECFTSRVDTVDCADLPSELHTHDYTADSVEGEAMTEIEKQLEEERRASEALQDMSAASDYTTNYSGTGNRSTKFPAYSAPKAASKDFSSQRTDASPSRTSEAVTTTYTTSGGKTVKTTTFRSGTTSQTTGSYNPKPITTVLGRPSFVSNPKKTKSDARTQKIVRIIIIWIALSVVISVTFSIIGAFVAMKEDDSRDTDYNNEYYFSAPDVSMPDIEIPEIPEINVPVIDTEEFYDEYACVNFGYIARGKTIAAQPSEPHFSETEPEVLDLTYGEKTDYPERDELMNLELPIKLFNYGENALYPFNVEITVISCNNDDGTVYISKPLYTAASRVMVEMGMFVDINLNFAVPKADEYMIQIILDNGVVEDYCYYYTFSVDDYE